MSNNMRSTKKLSPPPTRSEEDDVQDATVGLDSAIVASLTQVIYQVVDGVFQDEGFKEWAEINNVTQGDFIKKIYAASSNGTTAAKKKPALPQVSTSVLKNMVRSDFDDGWKQGTCLLSIKHKIISGRTPFSSCCAPSGRSYVCSDCAKKPAGKTLLADSKKRGFDVKLYRKTNAADAHKWATNKLKLLEKNNDSSLRVPEDNSSSDEAPTNEWVRYSHCKEGEELFIHDTYGLVAVMEESTYLVLGLDLEENGQMSKFTKKGAAKYEKLGFTISTEALEEETPDLAKRPPRTQEDN